MAKRRMFSMEIVDSDAFLEMPASTQLLYFHLNMRADDDGFVNSPKKIMKIVSCGDDDMKILIAKNFIIPFESGIVVIKHWRIHNLIRSDRHKSTLYADEKAMLEGKENGSYTRLSEPCKPNDNQMTSNYQPSGCVGEVSVGEVSVGEVSVERTHETDKPKRSSKSKPNPPESYAEVLEYASGRGRADLAKKFWDFFTAAENESERWYDSKGEPVRNWKQKFITWESFHPSQGSGVRKDNKEELYEMIMRGDFNE